MRRHRYERSRTTSPRATAASAPSASWPSSFWPRKVTWPMLWRAPRRNDRERSDSLSMDRTRAFVDRMVAWSPVLLLGGLAALTYWLDAQVQADTARRDGTARHDADMYIENFRA